MLFPDGKILHRRKRFLWKGKYWLVSRQSFKSSST
jgi:hypothetical protein